MEKRIEDSETVIAMYDVRGIQEYVFRTNRVKEIMGASMIVRDILRDALEYAVEKQGIKEKCITEWKGSDRPEEYLFDKPGEDILFEVIYVGGGNAVIIYKDKPTCIMGNKEISKYILDNTYSMNLAIAIVEKTDNYMNDYKKLEEEMGRIKASMPLTRLMGSFPITRQDTKTGYPLSEYDDNNPISKESFLKLEVFEKTKKTEKEEKEFDRMTSDKGSDSQLAIVHIDGNNMGKIIGENMQGIDNYKEAVDRIRKISFDIEKSYREAMKEVEDKLEEYVASDECTFPNKVIKENGEKRYQKYIREIICAGDDITFVCNAKVAISLCELFLKAISEKSFENGQKTFDYSACAGIAFIHSHFPFYEGYKVAEESCSNAKKRAKKEAGDNWEEVGNYIDFQICRHIATSSDLETNRIKNYTTGYDKKLLYRPYSIEEGTYSISWFKKLHKHFSDKIPANWSKKLRNSYNKSENELHTMASHMKSRDLPFPSEIVDGENILFFRDGVATMFDALEMSEYYIEIK